MREIVRLGLRLLLFTLCAGLLLSITNLVTEAPIREQTEVREANARKQVLTEAVEFEQYEADLSKYAHIDAVYVGRDGDRLVGYTFSLSPMGFKAEIDMTLGIDARGAITGLTIDSQSETAGLGTKIADESYLRQYYGQAADSDTIDDNIDAISGATVSSRAVLGAVDEAIRFSEWTLGIVGQENKALAEDKALTEDDIRRISLIEGGRTITSITPYSAIGFPAIADIYEVYVRGDTAYVFDMAYDEFDFTIAIKADGHIAQITVESDVTWSAALEAYAGLSTSSSLRAADAGVPDSFAIGVHQAMRFYNAYLAQEDA